MKTITTYVDLSTQMAKIMDGDELAMEGNFHDFRFKSKYGRSTSLHNYVHLMADYYEKQGLEVEIIHKTYKYVK